MRKSNSRKTILNEAGVFLVVILMIASTMVVTATDIFSDDFELCTPPTVQFPPTDWAIYDYNSNSITWEFSKINGNRCTQCKGGFPDDWLVTKQITVPSSGGIFSFTARGGYDNSIRWFRDTFEVYSSSTGNTPDIFLDAATGTYLGTDDATNTPKPYSYTITNSGPQWFAIRYIHTPLTIALVLYVDDVVLPDGSTEGFDSDPGDLVNWESTVVFGNNFNNRWEATNNVLPGAHSGTTCVQFNSNIIPATFTALLSTKDPINLRPHLGYLFKFHRDITFWMYHDTTSILPDSISVLINVSCPFLPTHWQPLKTAPESGTLAIYSRNDGYSGWESHSITLPWYYCLFKVRIGFLGTSAMGNNMYIDDVVVTAY